MSVEPDAGSGALERAARCFASKDLAGAREELERMLVVPDLSGFERAGILHARGVVHMEQGHLGPAAADLTAAAGLLRRVDVRRLGQVLDDAGVVDLYRGNIRRGSKTLAHALRCRIAAGDAVGAARTYNHLGLAAIKAGRFGEVESLLLRSQALWLMLRDTDGFADALDTQGKYLAARREWSSSLGLHLRALRLRAGSPDRYALAKTLTSVGVALRHLGRLPEALHVHHRSLQIRVRGRDAVGAANSRNALGLVLLDLGRWSAARKQLRRALAARLAMGDGVNVARIRRNVDRLTRKFTTSPR